MYGSDGREGELDLKSYAPWSRHCMCDTVYFSSRRIERVHADEKRSDRYRVYDVCNFYVIKWNIYFWININSSTSGDRLNIIHLCTYILALVAGFQLRCTSPTFSVGSHTYIVTSCPAKTHNRDFLLLLWSSMLVISRQNMLYNNGKH